MYDENLIKFFENLIEQESELEIIKLLFSELDDSQILDYLMRENKEDEE